MAWTSKIAISQQKDNTVEILWVQLSDGGELTAEILVNVSDFIKVDGTAATGCKIEEYEMQMFGAQDVGYASLEIGSQLVDACGVGRWVSDRTGRVRIEPIGLAQPET